MKSSKLSRKWSLPAPVQTERKIASFKIVVSIIGIAVTTIWFSSQYDPIRWFLYVSEAIFAAWLAVNLSVFFLHTDVRSVSKVSKLMTAFDVATIAALDVVALVQTPFNFLNGPHVSLYFVVISTSAVRHNSQLVKHTGIACGLVHLLLSFGCYLTHHIPFTFSVVNASALQFFWMFPNEIFIALAMALFGVIVGRATEELVASEQHYLALFENIPDGVLIVSAHMRILASNRKFQQMVGLAEHELIGRSLEQFLGEQSSSYSLTLDPEQMRESLFTQLYSPNRTIPVEVSLTPIDWSGQKCLELSIRDMSERYELELQLARAQKVQTVGKLAGGLAHDFNNILSGIFGAISLSRRMLKKMQTSRETEQYNRYLDTIFDCGQTASKILARLSTFSRSSIVETSTVDILDVLQETRSIMSNTLPQNVTVVVKKTQSITAKADRTSLTQALLNLCINAKDAIGDAAQGQIRLSAEQVSPGEAPGNLQLNPDEEYVMIQVSDNGSGMDDETQRKIFDPFFTTKESGQGTGIGLSMVYNVAVGHGGSVEVQSTPGIGTTFRIYIEASRDSLIPLE